jgi:hypothetical protein
MVPTMPFAPQSFERFPEAPARVTIDHRVDGVNNLGITISAFWRAVKCRPR